MTETCEDPEVIIRLQRLTFERQGESFPADQEREMRQVIAGLIKNERATYLVTKKDEAVCSASFFTWDKKCAYYLFGASNPELRNTQSGTLNLYDAFEQLFKMGIPSVDVCGVNSPQRGFFKLSFGANLIPYFCTKKESA